MKDYYIIGKKNIYPEAPNSSDWPKIIGYCYEENTFIFIEGNGYGFNGIVLPELAARENRWCRLFTALDAHWFLKIIGSKQFVDRESFEDFLRLKLSAVDILKS